MRKSIVLAAIAALLTLTGTVYAQTTNPGVAESAHDMTFAFDGRTEVYGNAAGDDGQICVYCHTPHRATDQTNGPLWNRAATTVTTYTLWANADLDGEVGSLLPESLACLSCHDGQVGVDNIINAPGRLDADGFATPVNLAISNYALVGTVTGTDLDLTSDHPVGVTYVDGGTTGMIAASTVTSTTNLELYSNGTADQVECATCHDVHNEAPSNTYYAMLREDPSGSAICTACHDK